MKISEMIHLSPEEITSKIGNGPYIYQDFDGTIIVDGVLNRIISNYMKDGKIVYDASVYAYGFKREENDNHQYIDADVLKKRFEDMTQDGVYEMIESEEQDGVVYQIPTYCGFDELLYYAESGMDVIVNCQPIKDVINEEYQRRIAKSDSTRK